ncbi:uncharacterized protein LOC128989070 [Macrosteles quadrilineatus]|uniref:uncharacterized protein LOC128989070 n=1 Tax=Macrosteles quadrilineatus TaxID=74068 RepID=UPI0023E31755|nr:uncharacterized protein LOC128989070 [Macrosteles quadrilineatus]
MVIWYVPSSTKMSTKLAVVFPLFVLMLATLLAAEKAADSATTAAADKVDKTQVATTTTSPATNEYGIPHNLMQIISSGGTVVLGVVVLAAIAALIMPMFNLRLCQVLGNCDTYAGAASGYSSNLYQNDVYGQYPQASYPTPNTYQKRSVEYMGPVLQMLKTAYDKYSQNPTASRNAL